MLKVIKIYQGSCWQYIVWIMKSFNKVFIWNRFNVKLFWHVIFNVSYRFIMSNNENMLPSNSTKCQKIDTVLCIVNNVKVELLPMQLVAVQNCMSISWFSYNLVARCIQRGSLGMAKLTTGIYQHAYHIKAYPVIHKCKCVAC